jgi:hypothetical protein
MVVPPQTAATKLLRYPARGLIIAAKNRSGELGRPQAESDIQKAMFEKPLICLIVHSLLLSGNPTSPVNKEPPPIVHYDPEQMNGPFASDPRVAQFHIDLRYFGPLAALASAFWGRFRIRRTFPQRQNVFFTWLGAWLGAMAGFTIICCLLPYGPPPSGHHDDLLGPQLISILYFLTWGLLFCAGSVGVAAEIIVQMLTLFRGSATARRVVIQNVLCMIGLGMVLFGGFIVTDWTRNWSFWDWNPIDNKPSVRPRP